MGFLNHQRYVALGNYRPSPSTWEASGNDLKRRRIMHGGQGWWVGWGWLVGWMYGKKTSSGCNPQEGFLSK